MASLRTAIFDFRGDASKLINELRKLEKEVRQVPDRTDLEFNAHVAKAVKDISGLEKKVDELGLHDPDITPHVNIGKLLADIEKAKATIASLPKDKTIDVRVRKIDTRQNTVLADINAIEARLEELKKKRPEIIVKAQTDDAEARLTQLNQRLQELRKKPTTTKVQADIERAKTQIRLVQAQLDELASKNPRATVDVQIDKAEARLAVLEAQFQELERKKIEVKIDVDRSAAGRVAQIGKTLERVTVDIERAGKSAEQAASPGLNLSGVFGQMSTVLRRLGPLVQGVAIALIASLLPAILAVGLAFGGAVVAAGALATALAAALGPAVLLLIPLFQKVSKVIQAYQARSAALKNSHKDARAAAESAAQAESQLAASRNAVRDANQQVVTAERNLAQARKAAADAISNARSQNVEAIKEEKNAAEDLARAEVDANKQIKQSIEDVKDARLALKDAELGQQQAKIDTKQAQLNLKKLREQMDLTGHQFDSTFKKFQDASFDVSGSGLKKALQGAGADTGGGKDPAQGMLDLQQAILDVKKAQQGEKDAADKTKHAHQDLNDKIKEATRLERGGIKAVDSYRSAQERLREATRNHARTQKTLNDLEKQGITNAPGVIAAQEGLRGAEQSRNDALSAQHDLLVKQAEDAGKASASLQTYKDQVKGLDPTEKKLLDLFIGVSKIFGTMKGATDGVFNGVIDSVNAVLPFMGVIGDKMKELGGIWGAQIKAFGAQIVLPSNLKNFGDIFKGTESLSASLGDTFRNTFQTLINVATAAMPFLTQIGTELDKWSGGLVNSTSDIDGLRKKLAPMVDAFKTFVSIAVEVGKVIVNAFLAGSGPINKFLHWIRDGLKSFNKFLKSAKGKNQVSQFFKDTLPFVKSFIGFVIRLGKILLIAFQIVLPILKPVLDAVNGLLDVFIFILKAVNFLISPFKTLIGIILSFFIPLGKMGQAFSKVGRFIEHAGGFFKAFIKLIKGAGERIFNTIFKPIINGWNSVKAFFGRLPGRFSKAIVKIMNAIEAVGKGVFKVITLPYRLAWKGVTKIFDGIKKPIGKAASAVWDGIKSAFGGVKNFFKNVFGSIAHFAGRYLNTVISIINVVIKGINKLTPGKIKLPGPLPDIPGIPDIPTIPKIKLASGGVTRGSTVATIGEAGQEAVIPLSKSVLSSLGDAIVQAMSFKAPKTQAAGHGHGGRGGPKSVFEHVEVHMTTPGGGPSDPRAGAVMFARELERRGGGR
jgi:phage-related protein